MKHRYTVPIVIVSVAAVLSVATYLVTGYVGFTPRRVADQLHVWNFTPSAAITEQIHRDGMTDEGKFLYLASHPQVEPRRDFNQICSGVTTDTSILGCYIESTKHIYLFHETDPRVDGTEDVMAAHEMLRAAWDRLSPAQRSPLVTALHHVLATNHDPDLDLAGQVKGVQRNDPEDKDAELYALVGTEIPVVGATLEVSYAHYLTERSTVTALNARSIAFLVGLKHKATALVTSLDKLNKTIDTQIDAFKAASAALDSDVASFNARADRPGGFATQGQFNVARAAIIAREDALNQTVATINAQIDIFNGDVKTLNGYVKTAESLAESLNVDVLAPIQHVIST